MIMGNGVEDERGGRAGMLREGGHWQSHGGMEQKTETMRSGGSEQQPEQQQQPHGMRQQRGRCQPPSAEVGRRYTRQDPILGS